MAKNYYQPEIETMPLEELQKLQSERLVEQVKFVYDNVKFYHDKMDEAGVKPEDIKAGLESIQSVPGRIEMLPTGTPYKVILDYSHVPEALKNILLTVREFARGRVIALFGCGGDRDRQKRPLMAEAAGRGADYVILTSDNARTEDPDAIITEAAAGLGPAVPHAVIRDRAEAIRFAVRMAETGDTVLLAGKGHEKYEIRADGMVPFDEEAIVRAAVRDRFGSRDGGGADNER